MTKILVVEDNPDTLELIVRHLARRPGWTVVTASDGAEALDMVLLHDMPDVVLMDLEVPVLDGWAVTRSLKSYSHTSDIPIIAVTAHTSRSTLARAFAVGCHDVVTKPIEREALLQAIDVALALHSRRVVARQTTMPLVPTLEH